MNEKKPRSVNENQKKKYLCPISQQIMVEPVTASDGHVYEKEKIEALLNYSSKPISPLTREVLNKNHTLVVNRWMRGEILSFLEENKGLIADDDVYLPEMWKVNLANAIRNGNEVQYQEWLRKDNRLKYVELEPNKTLVELVCETGTVNMAKKLILDLGVDAVKQRILSQKPIKEMHPFYLAWSLNSLNFVESLIEALHLSPEDIKFLKLDEEDEKPDELDEMFLRYAAEGNFEKMKWYLAFGADVNVQDANHRTALHVCAKSNLFDVCEYLINEANIQKDLEDDAGNTALEPVFLKAIYKSRRERVERLIKLGVDINTVDQNGKTALHLAIEADDRGICNYLIENGIDITLEDNEGNTALGPQFLKACEEKSLKKMKTWLALGCDINTRNAKNQTALHLAAINEWLEGCEFLLKKGVDANAKDHEGRNAFLLCVDEWSSVSKMIRKSIDVLLKASYSDAEATAAFLQSGQENPEIIEVLFNALETQDSDIRLAAARALLKLGNPTTAVIDALIKASEDQESDVRRAAVEALGKLQNPTTAVIDALIKASEDQESDVRRAAIEALGELQNPTAAVIDALIKALGDQKEYVRRAAVEALGKLQNPTTAVIDALIEASEDQEVGVRYAAIGALGKLQNPTTVVIDALIKALGDQKEYVCRAAIEAFGKLQNPTTAVIDALIEASEDQEVGVRYAAIGALGKLQNPTTVVIDALIKALGDQKEYVCRAAIEAFGKLQNPTTAVIDALIEASEDQEVGVAAIGALGKLQNPTTAVIDALIKASGDHEEQKENVRQAAIEALGKLQNPTTAVIDALIEASGDAYYAAIGALGKLQNPTTVVIDALIKALGDQKEYVRQAAIEALGKLQNPTTAVIDALIEASGDAYVRYDAIGALGKLQNPTTVVIDALIKALGDQNEYVRQAAIEALGKLQNPTTAVIDALIEASGDAYFRYTAIKALGKLQNPTTAVIDALIKASGDHEEYVRRAAIGALWELQNPTTAVIDALIEALGDQDEYVRRAAIGALGELQNPTTAVIDALIKALGDQKEYVRRAAIGALGELQNPTTAVIDALIEALGDQDEYVRRAAIGALGELQNPTTAVIDALIEALGDQDEDVRRAAIGALGELQNPTTAVIDALIKALGDQKEYVRRAAMGALGKLQNFTTAVIDALIEASEDQERYVRQAVSKVFTTKVQDFLKKLNVNEQILNCLLQHNRDFLSSKDKHGNTALMRVISHHHMKGIKWFVERGVSLSLKNEDGNTALILSILNQSDDISKYLIEKMHISEIELPNNEGDTPLILAARQGNKKLIAIFLEAGTNTKIKDKNQLSLAEILKKHGHETLIDFLNEKRKLVKYARIEENKRLRQEIDVLKEQMRLLQSQLISSGVFVTTSTKSQNEICYSTTYPQGLSLQQNPIDRCGFFSGTQRQKMAAEETRSERIPAATQEMPMQLSEDSTQSSSVFSSVINDRKRKEPDSDRDEQAQKRPKI